MGVDLCVRHTRGARRLALRRPMRVAERSHPRPLCWRLRWQGAKLAKAKQARSKEALPLSRQAICVRL